jgi:chromosome segregation ATPase
MKKDNEPLTNPATEHLNSQMPLDDRGPLDLERQIDELKLELVRSVEEAKKEADELMMAKITKYENEIATLKKTISELEQQLLTAQNDADNQRALANIPRY